MLGEVGVPIGLGPTLAVDNLWTKLGNWLIYGNNTYLPPTVKAPPAPPQSVWTTAPADGTSAQAVVDSVVSANAAQNALGFQQLMNDTAAKLDQPGINWGLLGIVGAGVIGMILLSGGRRR